MPYWKRTKSTVTLGQVALWRTELTSVTHLKMVRAVGVEPTLLAELDFESSASTNFTTPARLWS